MFTKILWATDGSHASDEALPHLESLAKQDDAAIVVFHCEEHLVGPRAYGYPVYVDEDDMVEKIRGQAAALADAGLEVATEIAPAHPSSGVAHAIAAAADKAGAALILVGTRGHTALGGLLLGSVTQRLLHIASCPVLVVPVTAAPELAAAEVAGGAAVEA